METRSPLTAVIMAKHGCTRLKAQRAAYMMDLAEQGWSRDRARKALRVSASTMRRYRREFSITFID